MSFILDAMLRYPESYNRGAPDLMFWRIDQSIHCYNHNLNIITTQKQNQQEDLTNIVPSNDNNSISLNRSISNTNCFEEDPFTNDTVFAVEVKSVNDVLSIWQILWLELLLKAGIPTEVLRVWNENQEYVEKIHKVSENKND